ncbi:hypothetical protein PENTCL1PPCAC_16878 [Pristionchus entomophagus]|uniref:Uncharacterized protein n=1 Tax=Pristionchus entomophagus TaxID=358040 RepID=A0AAV5TKB7_9BILA|nr:hypothetical protein PENTCL1PPCAC_16878 [Pristionchus entomophagus]
MTSDHDKMHPTEREGLMMGSERRQLSWFEKIVAALLCKGDLSEEKSAADPCSTGALFRTLHGFSFSSVKNSSLNRSKAISTLSSFSSSSEILLACLQ